MRGASRSRRSLGPILLGAWFLFGCYRPNLNDGGFLCREAGSKRCPDGYTCGPENRCWKQPDAGADADASDVADRPDGMSDADAMCIFEPLPGCTPSDAGLCDPVCQTGGCGCREKCSVNTQGAATCNALGQGIRRALMQTCDITSIGTTGQTDPCLPGLVCLEDACSGNNTGRCYKFCRTNDDCDNAPCIDSGNVGTTNAAGFKVCDVSYKTCNPITQSGCTGAMGCWLSTSDPTKTICDCEIPPYLMANAICTRSRECNPGLACAERGGDFRCVAVCELLMMGSDCVGANAVCRPFTVGGVSNPTYGFCD